MIEDRCCRSKLKESDRIRDELAKWASCSKTPRTAPPGRSRDDRASAPNPSPLAGEVAARSARVRARAARCVTIGLPRTLTRPLAALAAVLSRKGEGKVERVRHARALRSRMTNVSANCGTPSRRRFQSFKFRRQVPMSFMRIRLLRSTLVIEVDGGHMRSADCIATDGLRPRFACCVFGTTTCYRIWKAS